MQWIIIDILRNIFMFHAFVRRFTIMTSWMSCKILICVCWSVRHLCPIRSNNWIMTRHIIEKWCYFICQGSIIWSDGSYRPTYRNFIIQDIHDVTNYFSIMDCINRSVIIFYYIRLWLIVGIFAELAKLWTVITQLSYYQKNITTTTCD